MYSLATSLLKNILNLSGLLPKYCSSLKSSIKFIIETNGDILLEKLHTQNLSFENYEQLGDLLLKIIEVESKENQSELAEKTIAIYEYAQLESKTFSFDLIQKIQKAQSYRL